MSEPICVLMVVKTEEDSADVSALLKRVSSAMSAINMFSDKMAELDEDDPQLTSKVSPLLERLTLTLMSIYPDHRQMGLDIKAIGDFSVKQMENVRKEDL